MISSDNFRISRDEARSRLDPAQARESFGYHIDFVNGWETFRSPEELLSHLGIHQTHEKDFPEILLDLGRLSEAELDWARRYLEFYDRVGRLISTTTPRPRLQFDIAETLADWRVVEQFAARPARILEFGAGGGRQCVSAFLRNPDVIYTAIDSVLASYTVQNIVFSFISALRSRRVFIDFLDAQIAGETFPDIRAAEPGSIYHVPAWVDHSHLPERYYDVMFACHVHGELSHADFQRFVSLVNRCLADDGVLYVRSELATHHAKGFHELLDLNKMDVLEALRTHGMVPVYCAYQCMFETTVFARVDSAHYRRARASTAPESGFLDVERGSDAAVLAGRQYAERRLEWLAGRDLRVLFTGRGFYYFESLVAPFLDRFTHALVLDYEADPLSPAIAAQIRAFDPDVVVVASPFCFRTTEKIRSAAGGEFAIMLHKVVPICFSYRTLPGEAEPGLSSAVLVAGDIDRNRDEDPRLCLADGGFLLPGRTTAAEAGAR